MTDPLAFLAVALDAAEQAAKKAAALCGCHPPAPSWSFRDGDEPSDGRILVVDDPHPDVKRKIGRRWNGSYDGLFAAEHIARHDPASTLRRIAADRKLIADLLDEKHRACEDSWYNCSAADEYGKRDGSEECDCGRDDRVERRVRLIAEGWGWTAKEGPRSG